MPGGAELAVHSGGGDFGQEALVDVPPHVGVVELLRLGVDLVHGGDDLLQHQGRGDLEDGVPHVLGVGAVLVGVEFLDKGEHQLLHHRVHLPGGEVVEPGPLELFPGHGAVPCLDLSGKNALVGQAQHGALLGTQVVRLIQVMDEHEVGHLLHHVQGVGDAAGPEGLPEAVDFVSQFASDHVLLLLFPVPNIGGIAPAAEFQNFPALLQVGQGSLYRDFTNIRALLNDLRLGNLPKGALDDLPDTVRLTHATDGQDLHTGRKVPVGRRHYAQGIAHKGGVVAGSLVPSLGALLEGLIIGFLALLNEFFNTDIFAYDIACPVEQQQGQQAAHTAVTIVKGMNTEEVQNEHGNQ